MAASLLIPIIAPILGKVAGSLFPDPEAKAKAEAEMYRVLLDHQGQIEQAAGAIIKAEAESEHWLSANWRPLLMLTFGGLIVARWFGWAAPNLSEAEYLKLWSIVELGIGGYVIGRTAEKIVPSIAGSFKK